VQSLKGISHNKIEDTSEEHLKLAVIALDKLASEDYGLDPRSVKGNFSGATLTLNS